MRILVVDDSRFSRKLLCRQLEEWGHQVTAVESADAALTAARESDFDVVLIDYKVGPVDGLEVCWHLRSQQGTRHLYLMLMLPGSITNQFFEVVENGADEFLRKPLDAAWLQARLLAASRVVDMQHALTTLATTDPLTGALNRRHFFVRATEEVQRAKRYDRPLSVLMLDIDHFKRINDTYGHPAGDEAIRSLVRVCRSQERSSDLMGRLGGEEFAVLLPETDARGAVAVAERMRRSLAVTAVKPVGDAPSFTFTVSIGLAVLRPEDADIDATLARADGALYRAKNGGRNRVVLDAPAA